MVCPPTLTAASPVGATTTISCSTALRERPQERRFAGACAAGDEQVALATAQVVHRRAVFVGRRDAVRPDAGVRLDCVERCRRGCSHEQPSVRFGIRPKVMRARLSKPAVSGVSQVLLGPIGP